MSTKNIATVFWETLVMYTVDGLLQPSTIAEMTAVCIVLLNLLMLTHCVKDHAVSGVFWA